MSSETGVPEDLPRGSPELARPYRRDAERTRAELSDTIDALADRADKERVKARVKERTRETASEAVEAARRRPAIPIAVAAGAVALLARRRRKRAL